MARPKKQINVDQVRQLAAIHCTTAEMAAVLNCDPRTIERRFAAEVKAGRQHGCMSLKRVMWKKALEGNVTLLIWLSKNVLGFSDQPVIEANQESYSPPVDPLEAPPETNSSIQ